MLELVAQITCDDLLNNLDNGFVHIPLHKT